MTEIHLLSIALGSYDKTNIDVPLKKQKMLNAQIKLTLTGVGLISGSVEQLSTLGDGELGNWGSGTVRS